MVLDAVRALVQQAYVYADRFEVGLRQGIARVVQHVLVERHVALHGMRSQAVGQHDVIDVVVRSLDALVQFFQDTVRIVV